MLEDLNNRPRTQYLARVRNLHPALLDFDDRDSVGGSGKVHGDQDHSDDGHEHEEQTKAENKPH